MNALTPIGPSGTIRPTICTDTWLRAAVERLGALARERGGLVAVDEARGELLPFEVRCHLCDVRPIGVAETEHAYTRHLVEEGAALSPVSLRRAQEWLDGHLRSRHGLEGIAAAYEVESGMERWAL